MKNKQMVRRARRVSAVLAAGTMFQLGGCSFGEISFTQTVSGADIIVSLVRGAILQPIDAWITTAITDVFDTEG